jgi:Fur family ferric uptake transcriptional regulator
LRIVLTKERHVAGAAHGADATQGSGAYGAGRSTAQRRAVALAASGFAGAFTVDDLAAAVRLVSPGVSTATVYRSIATMARSGYVTQVGERDGAVLFARCEEAGHHHHVVCTGCGATAHAPCPVDGAGLAAMAPSGFVVTSHEVRLYGLCAACAGRYDGAADDCSCDPGPE